MIVTSRLELRPFTPELAGAIATGESGSRRWAAGFPREDDRDAALMFLRNPSSEFGSYEIGIGSTREAIGTIGFFGPPDAAGTVMVGYGLVEQARGLGYATEALRALVAYALTRPQVAQVLADTDLDNIASQRVLEKSGFSRSGQTDKTVLYTLTR